MFHLRTAAGGNGGAQSTDEPLLLPAEALTDTDLLNVNMEIEVFPADFSIAGTATLTARATVGNLTEFTLRLRNNFTATARLGSATGPLLTMAQVGTTTRRITLDRAYAAGETFTVHIQWSGVPVSRGLGSWYAQTVGGQPLMGTLSEPYYAYTWWPSKEGDVFEPGDNGDKATFQIAIIAPQALTAVSNGVLQGIDTLANSRRRHRWASTYPMAPYLACFSAGQYTQWSQNFPHPQAPGGQMPVVYYILPSSDTPANRAAWEHAFPGLTVLGNIYGTYPFIAEKYGTYQFPFSGGMEHQTMTGMGVFSESVTIHELAHQWWGNDVTCKTWNDIWLNEGFATYSEALWFERKAGSSGLPALFAAMNARRPSQVTDSVYCYNIADPGRIFSGTYSYRKGAWVLHTLRKVVGEQTFFNILAQYRAQYSGSAATTNDFRAVASAVSGRDLTRFFDQWVYGTGAPAYAFGYAPIAINGKNYVRLHLRQTQPSTFGVGGLFAGPIDARVNTTAGPFTVTLDHAAQTEWFTLPVPVPGTVAATGALAIDEFDWLLTTGKVSEPLLPGPPQIVEAAPAPGAALTDAPATIRLWFNEPVTTSAAHFTLRQGSAAGPVVSTTFAYDAPSRRVTLTPASPLPPGTYTLTASDALTATNGGARLDGEVVGTTLPSGDGIPQGAAQWSFSITPPQFCPADFDGNGMLNPDDLADFIAAYFSSPAGPGTDFDGNGTLNPDDLADFIAAFFGGC
jgi:hypothetical protein